MPLTTHILRPLRALFDRGEREVPFIAQMQWTDCGAACLAMVLAHHGRPVALAELREQLAIARDGVNARALLEVGQRYGLVGRGLRIEIADLTMLPRGSILHWQFNHFVVFDRTGPDGIWIVDPAHGRRLVRTRDLESSLTGVAIAFEAPTGHVARARPATPVRRHHLRRLYRELVTERPALVRVLVMSFLLRIFALSIPLLTGVVVDQVVPLHDTSLLLVAGLGVLFFVGFDALASILRAHLLLHIRTRLDTRMTLGFLEHLVALPYSFFQRHSTGDLLMRVSSNATVRELLTANTLSGLIDGCLVLVYSAVILAFSPALGLMVLALACMHVSIFIASRRRYRELLVEDLEVQATTQSQLVQMLGGIETLKCAGAENQRLAMWLNAYSDQLNVTLRRGGLSASVDVARRAVETLAPIGVLTFGAMSVMDGTISLGTMLAVNALAAALFSPLSALVQSALQLQLVGGYLDRIDDVLETPREQVAAAPAAHALRGAVSVRNLSFRYADSGPLAVDNVSLDIEPGMSVAIVGPSGSGKSTLAALLVGLHRPSSGEIYFDGRALGSLDVRSVRRQIGVVPQTPFVFGGTVRDNIALSSPEAELSRVAWAAQIACLHQTIQALPMTYDTVIADGGASLSGGQRQRIAIARAVLPSPPLLMLDEATSALDRVTEKRVIERLARTRATRIVVAHRLSTIIDSDLIVVMDNGRIVETGDHDQLIAQGGLYCKLAGSARFDLPGVEAAS